MALTVLAATIFIAERAATARCRRGARIRGLLRLGLVTAAAIFAQMLLGSWVTGHGAGLAYADFPLMNGSLVPDVGASQQAVQVAASRAARSSWRCSSSGRRSASVAPPTRRGRAASRLAMVVLVLVQLALGAGEHLVAAFGAASSCRTSPSVRRCGAHRSGWPLTLRRLRPAEVRARRPRRRPGAAASRRTRCAPTSR